MGFAYKKLKQSDKQSAPYVANKQYTIASSSYTENKITIYEAANIGDLETVEKLLESGTDVNQKKSSRLYSFNGSRNKGNC